MDIFVKPENELLVADRLAAAGVGEAEVADLLSEVIKFFVREGVLVKGVRYALPPSELGDHAPAAMLFVEVDCAAERALELEDEMWGSASILAHKVVSTHALTLSVC